MQCPVDSATLLMSERQGVEIDYCPQCRGVWLDRGELDKLIERSDSDDDARDSRRPEPRHSDDRYSSPPKHKKKKNWLGEIFEMD